MTVLASNVKAYVLVNNVMIPATAIIAHQIAKVMTLVHPALEALVRVFVKGLIVMPFVVELTAMIPVLETHAQQQIRVIMEQRSA